MAIVELHAGTEAVSTTEWSIPRDAAYAIGSPQTSDGVFQLFLDVSDMISGDELQIRIYEKVQAADTQRMVIQSILYGPQSPPVWVSPSLVLMHGWDMTLDAITGTITVTWSVRQVA